MGIQIEDGKGTGILAEVNLENLLRTLTVSGSLSSHESNDDGTSFTVVGTATVTSGIVVVLHMINNDPSLLFLVDRLTVQGVSISGGVAIPNQTSFFSLGYNRTVTSGGVALTPVTLNRTAVTVANVTTTGGNPNMTGTFVEGQRWYIQANGVAFDMTISRDDDIILGRTNTIEVRYTSDNTSGTVIANMKFIMVKDGEIP
jgi:hypothetical protein